MTLCDVLKQYIEHRNKNYRTTLFMEELIAIVLMKLPFGWSDQNVGNEFRVNRTTIFKYLRLVCKVLAARDNLYSRYISIPKDQNCNKLCKDLLGLSNSPKCVVLQITHISTNKLLVLT